MVLAVQTVPAVPAAGVAGGRWLQVRTGSDGPPSALVANLRKSVRRSWRESGFFILAVLERPSAACRPDGPVAQLDRVADFYSAGCRFESCRDRQVSIGVSIALANLSQFRLHYRLGWER